MQEVNETAVEMNVLEGARRASYVAAISNFFGGVPAATRVLAMVYIANITYWNAGNGGQLRSKHS